MLAKSEEGGLCSNLSLAVVTLMEEAKWMRILGLKVPDNFNAVTLSSIKSDYAQIKVNSLQCMSVCVLSVGWCSFYLKRRHVCGPLYLKFSSLS